MKGLGSGRVSDARAYTEWSARWIPPCDAPAGATKSSLRSGSVAGGQVKRCMASSHTSRSRAVATRQRGHRARRRQGGAAGEYLVVHEGEEGRDHERDALADHRRQLVAQALPCPGRQQHEGVLPRPPVGSPHSHRLDGEPGLCVGTGGWDTGREPGVCVCGFVAAVGSGIAGAASAYARPD